MHCVLAIIVQSLNDILSFLVPGLSIKPIVHGPLSLARLNHGIRVSAFYDITAELSIISPFFVRAGAARFSSEAGFLHPILVIKPPNSAV